MDLSKFNEAQLQAITSNAQYIKVIAGAGSGKTEVLTNRIAYLISEKGIPSKKILAITFTNKAANEMKQRINKVLEDNTFFGTIATFHSFCFRILKEDINLLGYSREFTILDTEDQKAILKNINKELKYDNDVFKVKSIISYISGIKNNYDEYEDEYLEDIYDEFYQRYEEYLKENNYLDFDDLILKTVEVLANNPLILDKWRYRYNYIHVDEFQDTNDSQYELVKLLGYNQNVFVVGDPDQNIYSWRGSKIDYILNFESYFPNAVEIKLEHNYRSKAHILEVANDLIQQNQQRIDKKLLPTIPSSSKVVVHRSESPIEEAAFIVETINDLIFEEDGVNYDDFAILYRANYISRIFEQTLTKARIDYKVIGSVRFFERKEIKDLIAYLRLSFNKDNLALQRIINVPKRGLGPKAIDKLFDYSMHSNQIPYDVLERDLDNVKFSSKQSSAIKSFVSVIEESKIHEDAYSRLKYISDYIDVIEEYHVLSEDYQIRKANINELLEYALSSNQSVEEFLSDIALFNNEEEDNSPKVSLMSMHSAKGLEFDYVFCVHLNDGIFPSMNTLEKGSFEEERRLAYVAFTRARKQLYLLSHKYSGYNYTSQPLSLFVKTLDNDHINGNVATKSSPSNKISLTNVKSIIPPKNSETFIQGDIVVHPTFKKGVIISIDGNIAKIAFSKEFGIKSISVDYIEKLKTNV